MGFAESLSCVESISNGRKQLRSLFWRLRAALKKATKKTSKQHFSFQYDPSSYALNFDDDGCCKHAKPQTFCSDIKNIQWVYVLWVEL
ncbi:hypothetical protein L484_002470 [Morus notabilis]|uniref:Uncharacterized protein n=1 Tax=Morus notabilis TaxID=981085 RepID=W9SET7_9ROSA|nr:hypothetical protein L484_002470 [Morus notabilis]